MSDSGQRRKQTMIERLGSEEAYRAYMRSLASKGGRRQVPKGWAVSKKKD